MLGNGLHVVQGSGPHLLGNGPHSCTQFYPNPIGLGNGPHMLG